MGEKHLIKIITLLWRVSTKIMKQSEQQALKKFGTRKLWATVSGYTISKVDAGLPVLVVALCSSSSKCSDTNRMPCKIR